MESCDNSDDVSCAPVARLNPAPVAQKEGHRKTKSDHGEWDV